MKQVILFAPQFDDALCNVVAAAIAQLMKQKKVPNIMLVQLALVNELDKFTYHDLSIMSRATIFDYSKVKSFQLLLAKESGMDLSNDPAFKTMGADAYFQFKSADDILDLCAGCFRTFTLAKDFCLIQDYEGVADTKALAQNLQNVKEEWETIKAKANRSSLDMTKEYMTAQLHYVRLTGKIGRIRVGGDANVEKSFLYDVAEDAIFACKSAWNDGTIRGLNLTTLSVIRNLLGKIGETDAANEKEIRERYILRQVYTSLYEAFKSASLAVLENKYQDGNKTAEAIIAKCEEDKKGYNLVSDEYEYIDNPTVINSVTTDIEILKSVVSILTTIMSSSQMVTFNKTYDKNLAKAIQKEEDMEDARDLTRAKTLGIVDGIMSASGPENPRMSAFVAGELHNIIRELRSDE